MTYIAGAELVRVVYLDGSVFDTTYHTHLDPGSLARALFEHDNGPAADEHARAHGTTLFYHELPTCGHSSRHRIGGVEYLMLFDADLKFAALYRRLGQHPK